MTAPAVRDPLRSRALAALREGRVMIVEAHHHGNDDGRGPHTFIATVRTSGRDSRRMYVVDYIDGQWQCTCDGWKSENRCAHIVAVQMVTGGAP